MMFDCAAVSRTRSSAYLLRSFWKRQSLKWKAASGRPWYKRPRRSRGVTAKHFPLIQSDRDIAPARQ